MAAFRLHTLGGNDLDIPIQAELGPMLNRYCAREPLTSYPGGHVLRWFARRKTWSSRRMC